MAHTSGAVCAIAAWILSPAWTTSGVEMLGAGMISYHEWYDDVHIPELLSLDGFVSARRYAGEDGTSFLATYEIDTDIATAKAAMDTAYTTYQNALKTGSTADAERQAYLNAEAALFSQAIRELSAVVEAVGGRRETAVGLAGLGDVLVTSLGGRNRLYGPDLRSQLRAQSTISNRPPPG